jgi:hypothetical protein
VSQCSHHRATPIVPEQTEQWITYTSRKRLDLHALALEPWDSPERNAAFTQMSELLQDAIEEVRIISAALREQSDILLNRAAALQERANQIQKRPGM